MRNYPNYMIEPRDTIDAYESGGEVCVRMGGVKDQVILTMGRREAWRLLDGLAELMDWSGPRTLDGHATLPISGVAELIAATMED